MARIRTVKPEFFTSEDIVGLTPIARLLYIALWCESDREGRLLWKPQTFKLRYFPGDDISVHSACDELVNGGLVKLYGENLAYIPSFGEHQHINPREAASTLPNPDATPRVRTRRARVEHASPRDDHAQGGREGKGRERKGKELEQEQEQRQTPRASRLSPDWTPTVELLTWVKTARPDVDVKAETENFRDYWLAKAGADASKLDWPRTWQRWMRNAYATNRAGKPYRKSDASVVDDLIAQGGIQ